MRDLDYDDYDDELDPEVEDPADTEVHNALGRYEQVKYIGAPVSYYEALELLIAKHDGLAEEGEVRVGYRESCTSSSPVMMIWTPGGTQYHIHTRHFEGEFDPEEFSADVLENLGLTTRVINNYLTD